MVLNKKQTKINTIGLIFNLKKKCANNSDQYEEYDEPETIEALAKTISQFGFTVLKFEQANDLAQRLESAKPDFILNIAEGLGKGRSRESEVPCILDSLKIPYSGSDAVTLGVALDKYLCSNLMRLARISVPAIYLVKDEQEIRKLQNKIDINKQYIVKPRWEGSSKGIFNTSIVSDFQELCQKANEIISLYHQPVVIEEFIRGSEVTVGVVGNKKLKIVGKMLIKPVQDKEDFVYSQEIKRDWQKQVVYAKYLADKKVDLSLNRIVKKVVKVLEIKDIARIDFRIGVDLVPKVIDVNPLPGLSPHYSDLPIMARLNDVSYEQLLSDFLKCSLSRWGLMEKI